MSKSLTCSQQEVREVFRQTHPPKANAWPRTSSGACQPVPSPKSPDWAQDLHQMEGRTRRHFGTAGQQRPHRSHRNHRTRQTHHEATQPHQLPTPVLLIAGGLERLHHTQLMKSRFNQKIKKPQFRLPRRRRCSCSCSCPRKPSLVRCITSYNMRQPCHLRANKSQELQQGTQSVFAECNTCQAGSAGAGAY